MDMSNSEQQVAANRGFARTLPRGELQTESPYSVSGLNELPRRRSRLISFLMSLPRVAILLCFAYPLITLLFIHLTVLMEGVLGMRGAIIGSYETPLSIVFNIAAMLLMGMTTFLPTGLAASFLTGRALNMRQHVLLFPASMSLLAWLPLDCC